MSGNISVTVDSQSEVISDSVDLQLDGEYMILDILEYFEQMSLLKRPRNSIVVKKDGIIVKDTMTVAQLLRPGEPVLRLFLEETPKRPTFTQQPTGNIYSVRGNPAPPPPIQQSGLINVPVLEDLNAGFNIPPPPPTPSLPNPVTNPYKNTAQPYPSAGSSFNMGMAQPVPLAPTFEPMPPQQPNQNEAILYCKIEDGSKQFDIQIVVPMFARFIDVRKKLFDAINNSGKFEYVWSDDQPYKLFWRNDLKMQFKKIDQPFNIIPGLIKDGRITMKVHREYNGGS